MNPDFLLNLTNAFRGLFGKGEAEIIEQLLKVSETAIHKYQILCPKSARKRNGDLEVIAAKIIRAVKLGRTLYVRKNGIKVIGYYNLNLILRDNEIIDIIERDISRKRKTDRFVWVDPAKKKAYGKL